MLESVNGFLTVVETILKRVDDTKKRRRSSEEIWGGLLGIDYLLSEWIAAAELTQVAIGLESIGAVRRVVANTMRSIRVERSLFGHSDRDSFSIGGLLQIYAPDLVSEFSKLIQQRRDLLEQYMEFQVSAEFDGRRRGERLDRSQWQSHEGYIRRLAGEMKGRATIPLARHDMATVQRSLDQIRKAQSELRSLISGTYPLNHGQ